MVALAGTTLLTACGHSLQEIPFGASKERVSIQIGARAASTAQRGALVLTPQIKAGGYQVQAQLENYTRASINHLVIGVFKLNGITEEAVLDGQGNPVKADIANDELDNAITISNLFVNTTYRIRCFAYKAPGEAAEDMISTLDADSYLDVTLTNDDRPTMENLRVKLIDVSVSGEANSSGITVVDGAFKPNGQVGISVGVPAP